MNQITCQQQIQDLKIGSIVIHTAAINANPEIGQTCQEKNIQFSVSGSTPIGWEDIELELQPVNNDFKMPPDFKMSAALKNDSDRVEIIVLGSELISDRLWWVQ